MPKRLIIFDLDGVVLKRHFLLEMSRHIGLLTYLRAVWLCFLFNAGKLSLSQLIRKVYARFKDVPLEEARHVFGHMRLADGCAEAIHAMRDAGNTVIFVSSGVPISFAASLAATVGADRGHGIEPALQTDASSLPRLTGEVEGRLSQDGRKSELVQQLLDEFGLQWSDVVVLADDRNNVEIMEKAGLSIGVNANLPVRRMATHLVDTGNLLDVLPFLSTGQPSTSAPGDTKQELFRKVVHACGCLVPLAALYAFHATLALLAVVAALFVLSEVTRLNGVRFPLIGHITVATVRVAEQRRFAFAPLALAIGVILCLVLFDWPVATAGILAATLADTAAALVGSRFGVHRLPHSPAKSLEGSLACFVVALLCSAFFLPFPHALFGALVAALVESLPTRGLDNLLTPLATGWALTLLCR